MKVAVVTAICVERDAISAAAARQASLAAALPGVERVDLFAEHIGRPLEVPGHHVRDAWALLRHPHFREADAAIFHWGIHCPMFDAVTLLGRGSGPHPVLMFHNMTPPELVDDERLRANLERSVVQLAHLTSLPLTFWTYSEENRRALRSFLGRDASVAFVPFPIAAPRPLADRRTSSPVRLLTVGRITRSKGTDVLVDAMGELATDPPAEVRLEIVGNRELSYVELTGSVERRIDELRMRDVVTISHDVDDEGLWSRLEAAHVVVCPSLHEGLCVPVVEAYLAGARVVAADGGNLRYIVQRPDPIVPAGDPVALAAALRQVIGEILTGAPVDRAGARAVCDIYGDDNARRALDIALRALVAPGSVVPLAWPPLITAPALS